MCDNPVFEFNKILNKYTKRPCHNCIGCRIDSQQLWKARCNSEYIKYPSAFVTFTYDDNHIKYSDINPVLPTLQTEQFRKYIDNIRHQIKKMELTPKNTLKDFKYFYCGEYGDSTLRCHYHALFFGLDFWDFKNFFKKTWKNGNVKVLPILQGGIGYVTDYMLKNINGDMAQKKYINKGLEAPFYSSSKGLGFDFMLANRDSIAKYGFIKIGSRRVQVPLYYRNLFQNYTEENIHSLDKVKIEQYQNVVSHFKRLGFTDYNDYMNYTRQATELSNYKNALNHGIANLPSFKTFGKTNNYKLVYDALLNA